MSHAIAAKMLRVRSPVCGAAKASHPYAPTAITVADSGAHEALYKIMVKV
jgi:hypothetical protein